MQRIHGQQHAISTLDAARAGERVHHAWIFHGPRGVGKFTTAIEFAALLLDPTLTPDLTGNLVADPNSKVRRLVDSGNHPDLHIIRKELALSSSNPQLRARKLSNIPVDILREFMIGGVSGDDRYHEPIVSHSPGMGHAKVFIIDEAERLDQVGQNALLKTLEEPARRTYIILVSTQLERLLPTIRSRCQPVRFAPLSEEAMSKWLRDAKHEQIDDAQRAWLIDFADGSPGMYQSALEDNLFAWHQQLGPLIHAFVNGTPDADAGSRMAALAEEYATLFVKANPEASKDAANKAGAERVLLLLASIARAGLRGVVHDPARTDPWLLAIDLVRRAERHIHSNVNYKNALENLAAQWATVMASPAAARMAALYV